MKKILYWATVAAAMVLLAESLYIQIRSHVPDQALGRKESRPAADPKGRSVARSQCLEESQIQVSFVGGQGLSEAQLRLMDECMAKKGFPSGKRAAHATSP